MGDNKISEALVNLANEAQQNFFGEHKMSEFFCSGHYHEESMRATLEAVFAHLQGEAVPDKGPWEVYAGEPGAVISDDFTHDVMLRVHGDFGSDEALSNYCTWLVGRLNHPQPAELSEVSGNSGELPPLPTPVRESVSECGPDYFDASQMRQYARAALAATGKQQGGENPAWRDELVREAHARGLMEGLNSPRPQQGGEVYPTRRGCRCIRCRQKAKMADAHAKGRGGWEDPAQCTADDLSRMLRDHVEKGDPRDVANFCMMLHQRGEAIAARQPVRTVNADEAPFGLTTAEKVAWARGANDAIKEYAAPPAQGIDLSPIAIRKLGELAAQGYVTNGVAIFNPATGQRGLVDNLGFVGWVGAERDSGAGVER